MESLLFIGQWQGFFQYGPEYGHLIEGHEAEFRLFIENYDDGKFTGRIIDWDGFGANGEVAYVNGFISADFVSFTKQYSQYHLIDEVGNCMTSEDKPGHTVIYEGRFDKESGNFIGTWEIAVDLEHSEEVTVQEITTGTWLMHRQESV